MEFTLFSFWICVMVCFAGYLYVKWMFGYWRRNGITYIEPKFPFGNLEVINRTQHLSQRLAKIYQQYKTNSMVGIYFLFRPVLLVLDLDLVRNIFIRDFQYFQDR